MEHIDIRKATRANVEELAYLFNEYRIFYGKPPDLEKAKRFLAERIANNESVIFIAFRRTNMAGFAQLYPLFSSVNMKKLWLLNDLYVHPNSRGEGIAMALIERAKRLCAETGAHGFILETEKENHIGIQLYKKAGLTADNEHVFYSWEIR